LAYAYELGLLIGQQGWVLLTGGRNVGSDGCSQSWCKSNGLTIGILPTDTSAMSKAVDIAIIPDMGTLAIISMSSLAMLSLPVDGCRHCIRNCACLERK